MHRRTAASGLALALLLPGPAARADEGDLSFLTLVGGGLMLLSGTAFCFAEEGGDPGPYATRSFYGGLGMSYARDNFQQKGGDLDPFVREHQPGGGGALAARRFVGKNDDAGLASDRDAPDPRPPETPTGANRDRGECVEPAVSCPNAPPNGIFNEPRPDDEDGPLPPAAVDGAAFGPDVVMSTKVEDGAAWGISARLGFRCHSRAALESHFEWLGEDFDLAFDTLGVERAFPDDPLNGKTELHFRHAATDVHLWTAGLNARFFLMTGRVQPYALGGLGLFRLREATVRYEVAQTRAGATEACPRAVARPVLGPGPQGSDPNVLMPSANCVYSAQGAATVIDTDQFKDVDLAARLGGGVEVHVTDRLSLNLEGVYVRPSGRVEAYDFVSLSAGVMFRFGGGLLQGPAAD